MTQEPQKNHAMIVIAIIGVIGTVIAAAITVLGNYNIEKLRQETELTRIALASIQTQGNGAQAPAESTISPSDQSTTQAPTKESIIALSDQFDGSNGSYDTTLWTCLNGCSIENLFLRDGVLNIKSNGGLTDMLSRSEWDYGKLTSLSGKVQISGNLYQGGTSWTWISLHEVMGCTLTGSESPFITCHVDSTGGVLYSTSDLPVDFDTWYLMEFEFDHNKDAIKFYLDNALIGEYVFTQVPDVVQVSVGIYSPVPSQTYIDDIRLTLNK